MLAKHTCQYFAPFASTSEAEYTTKYMTYLFVGLGNPGKEYDGTRHNVGRTILSAWSASRGCTDFEFNKTCHGFVSKNKRAILLLPETFMNNSGKAVGRTALFFKIKPEHVILLHDDVDIELGRTKLSFNRSAAGHKGVESVRRALKTEKFWRIRIGVQKKKRVDAMKLVLLKFKGDEGAVVKKVSKKILEGLDLILEKGPERAMNMINQN